MSRLPAFGIVACALFFSFGSPPQASDKNVGDPGIAPMKLAQASAPAKAEENQTPPRRLFVAASSNNFPPVNQLDEQGRLTGFGKDLAVAVIRAIDGEVRHIHSGNWKEILKWLAGGEADFIHDTGYTPDRTTFLDFSEPILEMSEKIFVLNDRFDIQSIGSLTGKKVACVDHHITHIYLMKLPEISCLIVPTPAAGLNALTSRQVDAFIYPEQIVRHLAYKQDVAGKIKTVGLSLRKLTWHMTVRKGATDTLVLLNKGIARVRASGEYDRIFNQWFGRPLVTGYNWNILVWTIGAVIALFAGAMLLLLLWTKSLRDQVNRRTHDLRESEATLRDYIATTSDWVWTTDVNHKYTFVSQQLVDLTGLPMEHWLNTTRLKVLAEARDPELVSAHIEIIRAHQPFRDLEYWIARPNGMYCFQVSGLPIFDDKGKFAGYRGTGRNITELKTAERQAQESQKLEAIGQLTGGVAHDFNNLMAAMIGNAELLRDHVGENEEASERLDGIDKAIQRGASLTSRLLAFSRTQTLFPVTTDIVKVIDGLNDLLIRTLGETIVVDFTLPADLWLAKIDPHQFESALVNMAINASHAMPDGGRLTVKASNITLDGAFAESHEVAMQGDYVKIEVRDTGTGIAPEILGRVFEPFFTTKEVGEGSGLGLSMVYGFTRQSHGHVTIESQLGVGTTIRLYLPRAVEQQHQEASEDETPLAEGGTERILVVEDEPSVLEISASMLRAHGYDVIEATDGAEAIRILVEDRTIDLLFTDIVLPGGINGVQISREAKRLRPDIKVLYTTGYAESVVPLVDDNDPEMLQINKPFRRIELLEKIRSLLDGRE